MRDLTRRSTAAAVVGLVLATAVGCSGDSYDDKARARLLVLGGDPLASYRPPGATDSSVTRDVDSGPSSERSQPQLHVRYTVADPKAALRTIVATARAAGWDVPTVRCRAGQIDIEAAKRFADFDGSVQITAPDTGPQAPVALTFAAPRPGVDNDRADVAPTPGGGPAQTCLDT
jgi:hypothetical protein